MFYAITAFSAHESAFEAQKEIEHKCLEQLGIYRPIAGILYSSSPHQKETELLLQGISRIFPNIQLVGFSTIAGFTQNSGYLKEGFFLTLIVSDSIAISCCMIDDVAQLQATNQFMEVFQETTNQLDMKEEPKACLIFPSFDRVNGETLIDQIQNTLPESCQVFGGYASDFWSDEDIECFPDNVSPVATTYQYFIKNGECVVSDNSMCCMFFSGPLELHSSCSYGWSDAGTKYGAKVVNSTFKEIDGMEPIDFLKKNQHPLGSNDCTYSEYVFWVHESGKEPYLRDIFYDIESRKLHTAGEILPENIMISFSFPDIEHVIKEYSSTISKIKGTYDLVLTFTCASHVPVIGKGIKEEQIQHKTFFPTSAIMAGYVYGEFGPLTNSEKSILHSCSSITIGLKEQGESNSKKYKRGKDETGFLHETIRSQKEHIESLEKQLHFFESGKSNKRKKFTEDCLGLILTSSNRSVTAYADQLSGLFKQHASTTGTKSPYPMSRNRIIDHLMELKRRVKKKFY